MFGDNEFTNVIELLCDDDEIRLRALHMRATEDNNVTTRWEREELKKPKKPLNEDDDQDDDADDDENAPKPLDEMTLVHRVQDSVENINSELEYYS